MAINATYFSVLTTVLNRWVGPVDRPIATACLSYPDIMVPFDQVVNALSAEVAASLSVRPDSAAVRDWHKLPDDFGDIFETTALLQALGVEPTYFDIAELRGGEIILDLNEEISDSLKEKFSLVLDTGTLEHCFNVGVAFRSMCSMLKKGGVLITHAPMAMLNHGFWNFSPTAYFDFLTQNGFKVLYLSGVKIKGHQEEVLNIKWTKRFAAPANALVLCVARRLEVRPLVWPVQTKYLGLIPAKALNEKTSP